MIHEDIFRLVRIVAKKYETPLRKIITANDGNVVDEITSGDVTAKMLFEELESVASQESVVLDRDYFSGLGRSSFVGHRFETTTLLQLISFFYKNNPRTQSSIQ